MTLDLLYREFKAAANFLRPGFSGFPEIQVALNGKQLVLTHDDKEVRITLPEKQL